MRIFVFPLIAVIFFLTGCNDFFSNEKMNGIPDKGKSFSTGVIKYLNDQIRSNPSDISLYLEKAKYYEQENWPVDALIDLNQIIKFDSANLDARAYRQSYYLKHNRFKDALSDLSFIERKTELSQSQQNSKLSALYGLQRYDLFFELSKQVSINYLNSFNRKLLGQYYLSNEDSLMAIRQFYFNYLQDEIDELQLLTLVDLLIEHSYTTAAIDVLDHVNSEDPYFKLVKSKILILNGSESEGVTLLKSLIDHGNASALFYINEFYQNKGVIDSAIYYNNLFLQNTDSSKQVLRLQGKYYQDKYFWNKSLQFYQAILKNDPADQEALRESGIVKGKIAYLQNLRSKRNTIPETNNLVPRKSDF